MIKPFSGIYFFPIFGLTYFPVWKVLVLKTTPFEGECAQLFSFSVCYRLEMFGQRDADITASSIPSFCIFCPSTFTFSSLVKYTPTPVLRQSFLEVQAGLKFLILEITIGRIDTVGYCQPILFFLMLRNSEITKS